MMQGILDPHAPLLVDSIIWRDVVLAETPERELFLEARINPDLLTRSANSVLSVGSAEPLTSH